MGEENRAESSAQSGVAATVKQHQGRLTPQELIERFCTPAAVGDLADPITRNGVRVTRGWCGYQGAEDESLLVGFDEGYDFLDYLMSRGWVPLHDKGEWPYLVFVAYRHGEDLAIAEYREGDLTVSEFGCMGQFTGAYRSLT
ncbi:MAG: hypothetical protein R2725_11835 [Solirubrobacterales bacterium]